MKLFAAFLLLVSFQTSNTSARAELEQKLAESNPFATGPLYIEAKVLVRSKSSVEGTYKLYWQSAEKWREDIEIGDHLDIRLGVNGETWQRTTYKGLSPVVSSARHAIFRGHIGIRPRDEVKPARPFSVAGKQATCYSVVAGKDEKVRNDKGSEICFDTMTGAILRLGSALFSEFTMVRGRPFPMVWYTPNSSFDTQIRVSRVDLDPKFPANTFEPPGDPAKPGCFSPSRPLLKETKAPRYPIEARQNRATGSTVVLARIGTDGKPNKMEIVNSSGPYFSDASMEAISAWRYEPSLCGSIAVEAETFIPTSYTMR